MGLTNSTKYPSFTRGDITISATKGTVDATYYSNDKTWRVYKGGTLTVATKTGKITKIVVNGGTVAFTGLTNKTWTGSATSVDLPCTTNSKLTSMVVTYE